MLILVPKSKQNEIEWNKEIIYHFIGYKLDNLAYVFGYDSMSEIDRVEDENGKTLMRFLKIEEIREVNDEFPLDVIDEELEELYESLEELPNMEEKKEVERWIINVKVRDELERIRKALEKRMKENFEFLKGCIFIETLENREKCLEKIKEIFPDYVIVSE
jgi:hypothetical protein